MGSQHGIYEEAKLELATTSLSTMVNLSLWHNCDAALACRCGARRGIAKTLDAAMRCLDLRVLLLQEGSNFGRQFLVLERFVISLQREIFTPLGFFEDLVLAVPGERAF